MSDYVKITVEKPGLDGTVESVPVSIENDKPLCKEVVRTLHLPVKTKEGLTDYIPLDKEFLIELLAYARSIEEKEPVYVVPESDRLKQLLEIKKTNVFDSSDFNLRKPWDLNH